MAHLLIHNAYSDGHESDTQADVKEPVSMSKKNLEQWWLDVAWPEVGDGHGAKRPKLGFYHKITVTASKFPGLVGQSREDAGR